MRDDVYVIAEKILEISRENPGKFCDYVVENDLRVYVEGYVYENNLGSEGELTYVDIEGFIDNKEKEEIIQYLKEDFYGTVNYT